MASIREILSLTPEQRRNTYGVKGTFIDSNGKTVARNIDKVTIDGNVFTDYGAFSFLREKSYVKSPVRSSSGAIDNLNSYATFITPHLKIDFGLMSIDSYRILMNLIYSKNEFTVTCYDVVNNKDTTNKMYFSTEEMPKLWTIVDALNGDENAIMLLGVQDYTVEMIGTNNEVETATITYKLNVPSNVDWFDDTEVSVEQPINLSLTVGDNAIIEVPDSTDSTKKVPTRISTITFGDRYKFKHWAEKSDGTGFKYIDTDNYLFRTNTILYAIWGKSAE